MDYKILPKATFTLNLRLRGGVEDHHKTNPSGSGIGSNIAKILGTHQKKKSAGLSFKDILEGNKLATNSKKTSWHNTYPIHCGTTELHPRSKYGYTKNKQVLFYIRKTRINLQIQLFLAQVYGPFPLGF